MQGTKRAAGARPARMALLALALALLTICAALFGYSPEKAYADVGNTIECQGDAPLTPS